MKKNLEKNTALYSEIKRLIEDARSTVAQTVNAGLTMLYWNIGKRINDEILKNNRAEYGKRIVSTLWRQLVIDYGKGFSAKYLRGMIQFYDPYLDIKIIASLVRQLIWNR